MMKPNRKKRERPHSSATPGSPRPPAPRGSRPGKPPRGRPPGRDDVPVIKEHPQYGSRIPAEELEFMRQQAEERARERKNRPPGTRPMGPRPAGTGRYVPRDTGPRGTGPRGPRPQGTPRYPGAPPRTPYRTGGPPNAGRAPYGERAGGTRGGAPYPPRDRASYPAQRERTPYPSQRERTPYPERRERFQGPPSARPERRPGKPYRTGVQSAGEGPPRGVPIPEEPPLSKVRNILMGYQQSAALLAAHSLGIFPEIHKRPQVAADLARRLDADPRGMETLLEALVALGLLHRHGATYVLPRELATYLVPSDGGATGMVEAAAELYAAWGDLARAVREGAPRVRLNSDALVEGDPARVRRYIRAVHTVSREAAGRVTELAPLLPGSTLLDVAGGSGVFAAEYARRTPELRATLFDLPPTIDVAREILREEGYEDAVTLYPGDYRSDPLPGPVDALLLSNVLQTESEENALELLRKAWEAIRPGGTLLVHGMMPSGPGMPTVPQALFSLRMYLIFDSGRSWSVEQVSEWLARERFAVRATRALGAPFESTLIIASRLE